MLPAIQKDASTPTEAWHFLYTQKFQHKLYGVSTVANLYILC